MLRCFCCKLYKPAYSFQHVAVKLDYQVGGLLSS